MSLMDELNRISDGISQKIKSATNEARTRSYLIDPFIGALGYNVNDPGDVLHEYTADIGKQEEKVDYAITRDRKPILFIEAKSAKTGLSGKHTAKLRRYFGTKSQVRFGILTNGIQYRFYADLDNPNIMDDKPFATIDLRLLHEEQVNELNIFTKSAFDLNRALAVARTLKYTLIFRQLLNTELDPLSRQLIKYFSRKVYKGRMKQSVIDEFTPLVRKAFNEFVDDKIASRLQTAIESEASPAETEAPITVEERPIQPISEDGEIPVFAKYKGHQFEATLIRFDHKRPQTSRILYSNNVYSTSRAAKVAINTVNPKIMAWSGWMFWKLRDPDTGKEREISDLRSDEGLRRRLLSQR